MQPLNRISKKEIRDLLGKGWLTHDGMWFYHTYQTLGIETANQLNKAAIKSLAPIEVKRVTQILGINGDDGMTFNDLQTFMQDALELTLPESVFGKLQFTSHPKNTLHWEWETGECFAYKGIKRMGIIDEYRCGVMYRIACWLEALEIEFSMHPKPDKCMMHTTGTCAGDINIRLRQKPVHDQSP
jgi:hypothetical protein